MSGVRKITYIGSRGESTRNGGVLAHISAANLSTGGCPGAPSKFDINGSRAKILADVVLASAEGPVGRGVPGIMRIDAGNCLEADLGHSPQAHWSKGEESY